jgi:coenzyme F420-0:L-glutamate ligase/coenzyme F420-1:gamma-L-glutamate ligase
MVAVPARSDAARPSVVSEANESEEVPSPWRGPAVSCAARLEVLAVPGLPVVAPGDDVGRLAEAALRGAGIALTDGDVLVVASKVLSRAEGRFADLQRVHPSPRARRIARTTGGDPRMVELVLRESAAISRVAAGVLVVRHRLGFVCANASIDLSNAHPPGELPGSGPWALLLPDDPDRSAERIRRTLTGATGAAIGEASGASRGASGEAVPSRAPVEIGVVVSDSLGRPFRLGTVGAAVGVAGLPPLWDRRGERDLFGRPLERTITALADQVAATADLVAGQAGEGRGLVLVRGLSFPVGEHAAAELVRPAAEDLYASERPCASDVSEARRARGSMSGSRGTRKVPR